MNLGLDLQTPGYSQLYVQVKELIGHDLHHDPGVTRDRLRLPHHLFCHPLVYGLVPKQGDHLSKPFRLASG